MEAALTALLLSDPAINALVGNRIAWLQQPQSVATTPYVTLQMISQNRNQTYQGITNLSESRVQIDVWSDMYLSCVSAAETILKRLSNERGSWILGCFHQSSRDLTDDGRDASKRLSRRSMDFIIFHRS